MGEAGMAGLRILVVEDSEFLGELINDILCEAGAVVALAESVPEALGILEAQPVDLVCLDILLGYETSFPIADVLASQGIPFIFVTACDPAIVPEKYRDQLLVDKMDIAMDLVAACHTAARAGS